MISREPCRAHRHRKADSAAVQGCFCKKKNGNVNHSSMLAGSPDNVFAAQIGRLCPQTGKPDREFDAADRPAAQICFI